MQIYVYEEYVDQHVVRILDSTTRSTKYTKNHVSFVNSIYSPSINKADIQPLYLYLRKQSGDEIECTFIKDIRAMQTITSTDAVADKTITKIPFYCHKCLTGYIKKDKFDDHVLYCAGTNIEAHVFKKDSHFFFDRHSSVHAPPFMIFFDVETRHEIKIIYSCSANNAECQKCLYIDV